MKRVFLVVNMVENCEDENVTDLYTSVYSTYKRAKEEHRNLINEIEDNYNKNGFSYNIEENGDMVAIYRSDNLEKHSINLVEKIVNF